MSRFIADPNIWYALTLGNHTGQYGTFPSYLVPDIFVGGAHAGVGAQPPDGTVHPNLTQYTYIHWQFYPISSPPNGTYFLRSRYQQTAFLNSLNLGENDSSCSSIEWDCSIGLELNTILPLGSIWSFTDAQQGNNTYHITNRPYGETSRLDVFPDWQKLRMSSNITGYQPGQQWQITPVMQINKTADLFIDGGLLNFRGSSTVPTNITAMVPMLASTTSSPSALPSTSAPSTSSSSTPVPSTTPPPSTTSHSGLSTGAKGGIGAGIGIVIALILAGILFWLLRRKKSKTVYARTRSNTGPPGYRQGSSTDVNKLDQDMEEASRMPLVEAHSEAAVEAPSNPARYELAGDFERYGEVMSENGSPTSERTVVEPDSRVV